MTDDSSISGYDLGPRLSPSPVDEAVVEVSPPRAAAHFLHEIWSNLAESFGAQSYYAAGLVLQKGLPYLIIPALVLIYGEHTYANYVLFYSSTLMFANLLALAIPNSIITFWYAHEDKPGLSWTYVLLLFESHVVVSAALGGIIYLLYRQSFGTSQATLLTMFTLLFALVYNFNALLTGVCRARSWSKGYFYAQVLAATAFLAGMILLRHWASLQLLIGLFLFSLVCQDLYLSRSVWEFLRSPLARFDPQLARQVLRYCLPMIPHLEATVFYYWVDKYLVSLYFPGAPFRLFTISFQYAFMQAFFAQVFAMHTFPLVCRLVGQHQHQKLRSVLRSYNLLLAALGAAWITLVLVLHGIGTKLRIDTFGFVLLGGAFLLWNVAGNYINVLWARFRSAAVTIVMLGAGLVLLATLAVGCWLRSITVCYVAHLVCAGAALLGFIYLESVSFKSPSAVTKVISP